MLYIFSKLVVKLKNIKLTKEKCHIFCLNDALKDLADPPHFSPEIGATETLKKSPETAETMASLMVGRCSVKTRHFTWKKTKRKIMYKSRKFAAPDLRNNKGFFRRYLH